MERSPMRLCSWLSRASTNLWRSFAYLYSAFSERSPWARATLISLGNSSCSSCSRAAISAFSFVFIFSARSIILGIVRGFATETDPSNSVFDVYLQIIEDLRGVSQIGVPNQGNNPQSLLLSSGCLALIAHRTDDDQLHIGRLQGISNHVKGSATGGFQILIPFAVMGGNHQARMFLRGTRARQQFAIGAVGKVLIAKNER